MNKEEFLKKIKAENDLINYLLERDFSCTLKFKLVFDERTEIDLFVYTLELRENSIWYKKLGFPEKQQGIQEEMIFATLWRWWEETKILFAIDNWIRHEKDIKADSMP